MNEKLIEIISKTIADTISERNSLKIPVGVSARHVHLTKEHLDILFGKDYILKKKKELMGGQFAAEECVTIIGFKLNAIEKVRVLGPLRDKTQVEISKTDAISLGLNPPIRESGDIKGSSPITIVGPRGAISLKEGCIIAKRHIHMSPEDSKRFNVKDDDIISVKINGQRGGILENVQIRVDEKYTLEMHIDTDEANCMGLKSGDFVEIVRDNRS
ncbi:MULTISPECIES: phosphate propanoyltransferase [Thermoanaerobacterium]|uniref:Phosphate propanoyltransferase n=1 Tax=Thermoanaerobacterium saccharolyticum (strain DSM 8691 / JW/SL-YS485) TaxID=1094508 RepID=I3VRV4_THESW|nr:MULTISPECIES: phosphate propanoyltransferase [Thermoanaerobacterium]AFK85249.1 Propanediol utilization protein [Thermoanaerobacterium saccharolyticum JW/SL-YS485]